MSVNCPSVKPRETAIKQTSSLHERSIVIFEQPNQSMEALTKSINRKPVQEVGRHGVTRCDVERSAETENFLNKITLACADLRIYARERILCLKNAREQLQ